MESRRFTKLERHFFALLRGFLEKSPDFRIFASRHSSSHSVVELLFCQGRAQQVFRLRVYGLRPVCYQIETEGGPLTRQFREMLFHLLGERNFRSRGGGGWVFQVFYSEAVVKALS